MGATIYSPLPSLADAATWAKAYERAPWATEKRARRRLQGDAQELRTMIANLGPNRAARRQWRTIRILSDGRHVQQRLHRSRIQKRIVRP